MTERLEPVLTRYTKDFLMEMARALAPDLSLSRRKADLVSALAKEIRRRAAAGDLTRSLDEAQQALIGLLLQRGGEIEYFEAEWRLALAGYCKFPAHAPCPSRASGSVESILRPLILRGLIIVLEPGHSPYVISRLFSGLFEAGKTRPRRIGIAPAVIAALKERGEPFSPPPLALDMWLRPAPEPPPLDEGAPWRFLRQLYLLWESFRMKPARCTLQGRLRKNEIRRRLKLLGTLGDEALLEEQFRLLRALGLIEVREGVSYLPPESERFWQGDDAAIFSALFRYFRNEPQLYSTEMEAIRYRVCSRFNLQVARMRSTLQLRRAFLKALTYIPPGQGLPLSALHCFISQGRAGGYLLSAEGVEALDQYLRYYTYQSAEPMKELEKQWIRFLLRQLRHWGLLAWTEGEDEVIVPSPAFYAVMRDEMQTPTHHWQLVIQPDAQVVVMGEPPIGVLAELGLLADLEEVRDRTLAFRLTRQSAYRAFRRGYSPARIRAFFEEHGQGAMAQNLRRTLDEWWEQYQRILLRRHRLVVQSRDPQVIEALLRSPAVAQVAYRPRDDLLVLPQRLGPTVQRLLKEMGLGWLAGRLSEKRRASLRLEGDRLVPTRPFPGLFLEATVSRFAVRTAEGWQLTPESVRLAVEEGMSTEEILETLSQMLAHPLPDVWRQRIKRWGGHYGTVQAVEVYLLRFASRKVVEEILAEMPTLRRRMRPLATEKEALAIVQMKDWPGVKEHLESLGVAFEMKRWW